MPIPHQMSDTDIEEVKRAWVAAVKRALTAGVDFIGIQNAHGYLLHSFLSPVTNRRMDHYGDSFENRIRLPLEIVKLTRQTVGPNVPIVQRISATDCLEESMPAVESWRLEDTVRFAQILADKG